MISMTCDQERLMIPMLLEQLGDTLYIFPRREILMEKYLPTASLISYPNLYSVFLTRQIDNENNFVHKI